MCRQDYGPCRNWVCPGFAQTLGFFPCDNRPNCEIIYNKVPKEVDGERYCPDCRKLTAQERQKRIKKASETKRKRRVAAVATAAGMVPQQQGESSNMGQSPLVSAHGSEDSLAAASTAYAEPEQQGESSTMSYSPIVSARGPEDFLAPPNDTEPPSHANDPATDSFSAPDESLAPPNDTEPPNNSKNPAMDSLSAPDAILATPGEIEPAVINNSDFGMTFDAPTQDSFHDPDQFLPPPNTVEPPPINDNDSDMTFDDAEALLELFRNGDRSLATPEPRSDSPQFPIDPALVQVDYIMASGPDKVRNMQLAQEFLADMGLWPES